jgi:hypothetical protein
MNVVITIVVEGKKDRRVLARLAPPGCNIVLCQGKHGMRSYIDGLASQNQTATASEITIGFRDRDFDYEMRPNPGLSKANSLAATDMKHLDIFVSHRRTIENYLLQPSTYAAYFADVPEQARRRLLSPDQYADVLHTAATQLHHYQAVRAALGEIRRPNPLDAALLREPFEPSATYLKSGQLPTRLDRLACLEGARAVLHRYQQNADQIADWDAFEATFSKFEAFFDATFYDQQLYLEWFQAKDLIAVFSRLMMSQGAPFPWNSFETFAIDNFDHTQFPDLVEFRLILQQRLSQN